MKTNIVTLPQSASLSLRPLRLSDSELFEVWFADYEVVKFSMSLFMKLKGAYEVRRWLEGIIASDTSLNLGLVRNDTKRLIGYAGIAGISTTNNSGEYFIFIGDKASWGQGLGTEATRLIVDYGFRTLNLNRIQLTVSDLNVGGVKAYGRAGFTEEGRMRQAAFRDGAYHDKIMMSVLRSEWAGR